MGLWIVFCLLSSGLATVVQLLNRYQFVTKDAMMSAPATFPATGHVGADTTNWYLHAWINTASADSDICLLSVTSTDTAKVCRSGSDFQIVIAGIAYSMTAAVFELSKWFFIEIGSTNLGYYGLIQLRNGTPYTFPLTGSPLTIKETSSINYPDTPFPMNYDVRTT